MLTVVESDLIPAAEAAVLLGVSIPTLHRWVENGRLEEAVKAPGLRGARFFRRSAVESLAASRDAKEPAAS